MYRRHVSSVLVPGLAHRRARLVRGDQETAQWALELQRSYSVVTQPTRKENKQCLHLRICDDFCWSLEAARCFASRGVRWEPTRRELDAGGGGFLHLGAKRPARKRRVCVRERGSHSFREKCSAEHSPVEPAKQLVPPTVIEVTAG